MLPVAKAPCVEQDFQLGVSLLLTLNLLDPPRMAALALASPVSKWRTVQVVSRTPAMVFLFPHDAPRRPFP